MIMLHIRSSCHPLSTHSKRGKAVTYKSTVSPSLLYNVKEILSTAKDVLVSMAAKAMKPPLFNFPLIECIYIHNLMHLPLRFFISPCPLLFIYYDINIYFTKNDIYTPVAFICETIYNSTICEGIAFHMYAFSFLPFSAGLEKPDLPAFLFTIFIKEFL